MLMGREGVGFVQRSDAEIGGETNRGLLWGQLGDMQKDHSDECEGLMSMTQHV